MSACHKKSIVTILPQDLRFFVVTKEVMYFLNLQSSVYITFLVTTSSFQVEKVLVVYMNYIYQSTTHHVCIKSYVLLPKAIFYIPCSIHFLALNTLFSSLYLDQY